MPSDRPPSNIEDKSVRYSFRDEGNLAEIIVTDKDKLWAIVESICSDLGSPITDKNRDYFFNKEMGGELRPGGAFSVKLYKPGVIWARVQNGRGEPNTSTLKVAVDRACESTLQLLQQQLQSAGIDTSTWGTGQAKTLANLQKEIEGGETLLTTDKDGKLLRKVVVGGVEIYYISPDGRKYRLKEEKQVFKDGRERQRDLGQSVLEKMKPDEDPDSAMVRGVREELGISGEITLITTGTEEQLFMSPSYPGLQSQSIRHKFEVTLSEGQFKSDGYVEHQEDKSTYFVWEEVKSNK